MDRPLNKFETRSELTRTALFAAAQRVIVREGYERAQLESIAREAGRTKGSIYAHFASKEELFLAMIEFIIAERVRAIGTLSLDQRGEALRTAVRDLVVQASFDDDWLVVLLEYKLHVHRNPEAVRRIRESYVQMWDTFQAVLQRIAPHSRRSPDEVSTCLEILRAVPAALLLEAPLRRRSASSIKLRRGMLENVFNLLFPPVRR